VIIKGGQTLAEFKKFCRTSEGVSELAALQPSTENKRKEAMIIDIIRVITFI
jgi:hypothetical protein